MVGRSSEVGRTSTVGGGLCSLGEDRGEENEEDEDEHGRRLIPKRRFHRPEVLHG